MFAGHTIRCAGFDEEIQRSSVATQKVFTTWADFKIVMKTEHHLPSVQRFNKKKL